MGDKTEAEPLNWQVNWLNMRNEKTDKGACADHSKAKANEARFVFI